MIGIKNSQMEDTQRARYGGRAQSSHAFSKSFTLSKYPSIHQFRSSLNPILFGVLWRFHYISEVEEIVSHW